MEIEYSSQKFGSYETISYLGKGSFAEVYLAKHREQGTNVAIKIIDPSLVDEKTSEQFYQEVRLLAQLRHPHIVQTLDFGIEEGTPYIVMEYAPKGNLRDCYPAGTKIPFSTLISYVWQIALALQHAHNNRVIHRDLKPENLLVRTNGLIQLSDFNLALVLPEENSGFLSTQNVAGSAWYIAPEQIQGKPSRASDQYALGIMVYEWLCGSKPFEGDSRYALLNQHINQMPPPLYERFPEISAAIERVVMRALEKDPQKRFPTIGEFAFAFEQANLLASHLPYWLGSDLERTPTEIPLPAWLNSLGSDLEGTPTEIPLPAWLRKNGSEKEELASPLSNKTLQNSTREVRGLVNIVKKIIHQKIVYYGIELGGKVENLQFIQRTLDIAGVEGENMILFDLPLVEYAYGFQIRYHLCTAQVPVLYARTHAAILQGVCGIVFVVDSSASKLQENITCWQELQAQLLKMNKDLKTFPLVMQWNNREAEDWLPISVLEKYLNIYNAPSFEAVAETGKGVQESLDAIIERMKATLA